MQPLATEDARNPFIRASSLEGLLAWNDVEFVRCAYVTIIGRQPDSGGEAFYARRIREGHSKLEILWQLRRSREGKTHDPGIADLDRALRRAAWARTPLVGRILRPLVGGERNDRLARVHRSLMNELSLIRNELQSRSRGGGELNQARKASRDFHLSPWDENTELLNAGDLSPATQEVMKILTGSKSA